MMAHLVDFLREEVYLTCTVLALKGALLLVTQSFLHKYSVRGDSRGDHELRVQLLVGSLAHYEQCSHLGTALPMRGAYLQYCSRALGFILHPLAQRVSGWLPDSYRLALAMGACHLTLQRLNHELLQLLTFNIPWKEFRMEKKNEALYALGGIVRTGL